MWWSSLFTDMRPSDFFNFSFLPKYGTAFVRGIEYTLLLAVVSIWICLAAVQLFTPMLSADTQAQIETALRQSTVAGWVVNWNPLGVMFQ